MVWVRSEYADELAVVSAWLAVLLPWNVSYASEIQGAEGSVLYVRFTFLEVRYLLDNPVFERLSLASPMFGRLNELVTGGIVFAYDLWTVGAAIVAVAFALSLAMYFREERVTELLPVPPVRLMGGLLVAASLVLAGSTVVFYQRALFNEFPVPVGLVVLLVLGVTLLRVELLGDEGEEPADSGTSA